MQRRGPLGFPDIKKVKKKIILKLLQLILHVNVGIYLGKCHLLIDVMINLTLNHQCYQLNHKFSECFYIC